VPLLRESTVALLLTPFAQLNEDNPLCGAKMMKQHYIDYKYYSKILEGLVTIPPVEPGDTVFWHCDLIHAVEEEHRGEGDSSVFYIGTVPLCEKNLKYARENIHNFEKGLSPTDFPAEDFEKNMNEERAKRDNLKTDSALQFMGFRGYPLSDDKKENEFLSKMNSIVNSV